MPNQENIVTKLGLNLVCLKRILLTQTIYGLSRGVAVVLCQACCP